MVCLDYEDYYEKLWCNYPNMDRICCLNFFMRMSKFPKLAISFVQCRISNK